MANPQTENGFTKIADEIMDALIKIRIPGEARQILDVILRKTYGWNKTSDQIHLSQFEEMTGLVRPSICRAIRKLLQMNLITKTGSAISMFTKKGNDIAATYSFQKDHEEWCTLAKKPTSINKNANVEHVDVNAKRTLAKTLTSISIDSSKEKEKEYGLFLSNGFNTFYGVYPKKVARTSALEAWGQLWNEKKSKFHIGRLDEDQMIKIIDALEIQKTSEAWQDKKYIPNPATWLRGHRWNDEVEVVAARKENQVVV